MLLQRNIQKENNPSHRKYSGWNGSTIKISCWADLAWPSAGIKKQTKKLVQPYHLHCFLQILNRNCWWRWYQTISFESRSILICDLSLQLFRTKQIPFFYWRQYITKFISGPFFFFFREVKFFIVISLEPTQQPFKDLYCGGIAHYTTTKDTKNSSSHKLIFA